jgi:hypothetical protein
MFEKFRWDVTLNNQIFDVMLLYRQNDGLRLLPTFCGLGG